MNLNTVLIVALQLCVLTYYLGVLVYMLPLPSRRIKRWGPVLIEDSLYAAFLISILSLILYASDYISSFSGYTLAEVIGYIRTNIIALFITNYIARITIMFLSIIPGKFGSLVSLLFFPFFLSFYAMVLASAIALVLTLLVHSAKTVLVSLGALLYSIPLRLGRNAGASLIAFIVIGNAMLPYLPHWVAFILTSISTGYIESISTYNRSVYNLWGVVKGESGGNPTYALIYFNETETGEIYRYIVGRDGGYYISKPYNYLPQGSYTVYVEYMGLILRPKNYKVRIPEDLQLTNNYIDMPYRLDFSIDNTVFLEPQIIIRSNCEIYNVSIISSNKITLKCLLTPYKSYSMYIISNNYCSMEINEHSEIYYVVAGSDKMAWRGVPVKIKKIDFTSYKSRPTIILDTYCISSEIIEPTLSEAYYAHPSPSYSIFDPLVQLTLLGIGYSMALFSFISLFTMVSLSLARVIGAYYPRILFER